MAGRSTSGRFDPSKDNPQQLVTRNTRLGDYHFMIRLTDRAGWQQLKAVAIKVGQ